MKYLIIIEPTSTSYSAYAPDLEGCVAAGMTVEEVERNMQEAIAFHLQGLREEGYAIPRPHSLAQYVSVAA
jgi:predicted RNase H-like HicB family nuclease